MPIYSRTELDRVAGKYGFVRDSFEKVLRIMKILEFLNTQEYLKEHFILKGGTAINLTIFNMPRLSVDIDMDFEPNCSSEEMADAREKAASILQLYMESEGYVLGSDSRKSHSLDAFHYRYQNVAGNTDMLKIEINYSLRCHLFTARFRPILAEAFGQALDVNVLDPIEIFASKANALVSRAAARDLYDFYNMISNDMFADRRDMFRKSIIFYNTISADSVNKEFDTSALDTITMTKIRRDLIPMLSDRGKFSLEMRMKRTKEYIADLMKTSDAEKEYMERFEKKEYRPELLFDDEDILDRISNHPMAMWKCR